MKRIVVVGAAGRAGRAAVTEALRRGHQVTAVVRDPARHPDLAADCARAAGNDPGGAADHPRVPETATGKAADRVRTAGDMSDRAADRARVPETATGKAADRVRTAGDVTDRAADRARVPETATGKAADRVRTAGDMSDRAADRVRVVAGDVTDEAVVAAVAAGHDAVIAAVYDPAAPAGDFFPTAARALVGAGVGRLVWVGLASVLASADGTLLMDTDGYPQEYRTFYLAHAAGNAVLRAADAGPDWLIISPAGDFDHGGAFTGSYRTAAARAESRISYADFAVALLDEVETPQHHRTHIGVESR